MGMTMTQKILAAHTGLDAVEPGQLIEAQVDRILGNDITTPIAIREMEACGACSLFDPEKVVFVLDHFTPNKDIKSAEQCKAVREFAQKHAVEHFYDVGRAGIEHVLLPDQGLVWPGCCVVGADSHTCTYGALGAFSTGVGSTDIAAAMLTGKLWFKVPQAIRVVLTNKPRKWVSGKDVILHLIGKIGVDGARYASLEFTGDGVSALSMDDRFCIANMAIEAGAKNGIFPVDEKTMEYGKDRFRGEPIVYAADPDAAYTETIEMDLSALEPTVAFPHLPENARLARESGDVKLDQAVIGSCTNGRITDLRIAASILKGRKVAPGLRCIVIPGSQEVYLQALREGLAETFVEAGAVFSMPTCGPCLGGHMGVLAKGERAISTTNRNFVGRMGHTESEVYLASPAVAAASAVTGRITDPSALD